MRDLNQSPLPMTLFALASASPLVLFALGIWAGGLWAFAGLVYMAALVAVLDQIKGLFMGDAPDGAEFPAADTLLVVLALGHLVTLPMVVWAVSGDSDLSGWQRAALMLGAGLWFGQVSNPMAHELIHRGDRMLYGLGVSVYTSLLFGHHSSAHRLVHHRHAASAADPNSARAGEGFYRFFLRAWGGSFMRGWAEENTLRARSQAGRGLHPYAVYLGGAMLALALAFLIAGGWGVVVWAGLALHAQVQLMLSDYVQHYGLTRAPRDGGRLEPVAARHSWNAPQWFSSAMMLNAPRHSDHHAHPARPYPALRLPDATDAPHLPWPLPVACTLALFPALWKRAIRPHLAKWKAK
jgi:alkane 1-monooxygenase